MKTQKSCCDFFRKLCKKQETPPPDHPKSKPITLGQERTEITISSKTISSNHNPKSKRIKEKPQKELEIEGNSIFYDKNSGLVDSIDQNQALDNLEVAFGIINHESPSEDSESFPNEKFSKVLKGINFKEILEGEDSIIASGRSGS
jgi:hypothetical protein